MPNDYATYYPQMQDVSGLQPVFQNIGAQQALHNQLMQQQQQEMQDAANIGASYGKGLGGLNPLAMAAMLRGQTPGMMGTGQTPNWTNPYTNTGGYFDQGAYGNVYGVGTGGFE